MIDPVDTEREPTEDRPEARIFPNPVVPVGTGSTSINPGVIPGIAVSPELAGPQVEDPDGCGSQEEVWHYRTQAEVAAETALEAPASKVWHRETPPDAGDLAVQESAARPRDIPEAT